MERTPPVKSTSFSINGNGYINGGLQIPELEAISECEQSKECDHDQSFEGDSSHQDSSLPQAQALEDVSRFLETLSGTKDKSNPPAISNSVESLLKMIQTMITCYDSRPKFGQNKEQDSLFIEAVNRISRLINILSQFASNSVTASCLNQASDILHRAMSILHREFCAILESRIHINNAANPNTPKASTQSSIGSHQASDRCTRQEPLSMEGEEFLAYSPEAISNMNRIATAMISSGYECECCLVYNMVRRNAFDTALDMVGFENISIDDALRMQWELLEGKIAMWISVVKHFSLALFTCEHQLCSSIFAGYPSISESLFTDLAFAVMVRFLNFAQAIALTTRSTEKLFKFLDIYEALLEVIHVIEENYASGECSQELKLETWGAKCCIGQAAVSIFCDLENSIMRDNSRIPVPSGAVHPLTRYTMNYLKYACEYKSTLEQVFQQHHKTERSNESNGAVSEIKEGANEDGTPKTSPFSVQLKLVMELLDENLDMKAKLYRDPALQYIFLMNNGRYILQKIKGSSDIYDMLGTMWCRKRSSDLRKYHKCYTRETWSRLLQCLNHEGLQVNGKVPKSILKERFRMFNSLLEEIYKTQSTWVVSDEQLQSELRVSVSAVVIPAYRSFLGRFQQYLSGARHAEKYIKYQLEDIENLIEGLFDGNPTSMARRRT